MENVISPALAAEVPIKTKKRRKRLLLGIGAGVVVLGGAVALAPTIASTSPVRAFVLGKINAKIPGKLEIQDWSFSWLGANTIKGIAFTDDAGHVVTVEDVHTARLTLLQGLLGGRVIEVDVSKIRGQLPTVLKPKAVAEPEAQVAPAKSGGPNKIPEAGLAFNITDVDVTAEAPGQKPVRITADTLLALDATDLNKITASSGIKLAQEGGAQGTLAFKAQVEKLLTADRELDKDGAQVDVKLDVVGLPIAAIDAMVDGAVNNLAGLQINNSPPHFQGLVSALLDAKLLDVHVSAKGGMKDLAAQVKVDADKKTIVALNVASDGQTIKVSPGELLRLPITQAFLDKVAPGQVAISNVLFVVGMEKFSIPVASNKMDLAAANFSIQGGIVSQSKIAFELTSAQIKTTDGKPIGLSEFGFFANSAKLGDGISVGLATHPFVGATSDDLTLTAQVTHPLADDRSIAVKLDLPLTIADAFAAQNGKIVAFAGKQLAITAKAQNLGGPNIPFQLSSDNPALKMDVQGAFDKTAGLSLAHSSIRTQIANALIASFVPEKSWEGKKKPDLSNAGDLTADVDVAALAFKPGDASGLAGVPGFKNIQLNTTVSNFDTALVGALAGKEEIVHDALGGKVGITANLSAKDNHLLAQLAPKGDTLGGTITADIASSKPNQREVALSGGVSFKATQQLVAQFLKPTVDAKGKPSGLAPVGDFNLTIDFGGTNIVLGAAGPDFAASQLALAANGSGLSLLDVAKNQKYAAALTDFKVSGANLKDKLDAGFTLTLGSSGQVVVQATVKQPVGADGVFDPAHAAREASVVATNIPLALADAVVNKDGLLQSVLGASLTRADIAVTQAAVQASMIPKDGSPAPMPDTQLALKALTTPQAQIKPFNATVKSSGDVALAGDVDAQLTLTPDLVAHYGAMINPILGSVQSGTNKPVRLLVTGKSFHLNTNDPTAQATHVDGTMDAGTLQLAPGSLVTQVESALQAAQIMSSSTANQTVTIPPFAFALDGTKLSYKDFKVTSGNLAMDFSGNVDVKTQAMNMNMVIPGQSLAAMSPMLAKYIKPGNDLSVPITGTATKPKLDSAAMTKSLIGMGAKAGLGGLLGGGAKDGAETNKDKAKDVLKGLFGK